MIPVKIKGQPYIISTNEAGGAGGWAAACARGVSAFGYPQIIDVADITNPTRSLTGRAGSPPSFLMRVGPSSAQAPDFQYAISLCSRNCSGHQLAVVGKGNGLDKAKPNGNGN
jgi:hypothetical protein